MKTFLQFLAEKREDAPSKTASSISLPDGSIEEITKLDSDHPSSYPWWETVDPSFRAHYKKNEKKGKDGKPDGFYSHGDLWQIGSFCVILVSLDTSIEYSPKKGSCQIEFIAKLSKNAKLKYSALDVALYALSKAFGQKAAYLQANNAKLVEFYTGEKAKFTPVSKSEFRDHSEKKGKYADPSAQYSGFLTRDISSFPPPKERQANS